MDKKTMYKKGPDSVIFTESGIILICLAWTIIGLAGTCAFVDTRIGIVLAHVGGVGIMGLLGCLAGFIAKRKGHGYWKAFLLGFFPPVILGILSVCFVHGSGGRGCGGIVSIAAALIVILGYSFARRKDSGKRAES